MPKIVRIVIKGKSGFLDTDIWSDKLVLTPNMISYCCEPLFEDCDHLKREWMFKTNNPAFKEKFEKVAELIPDEVLNRKQDIFYLDIGSIEFQITYDDRRRTKKLFWLSAADFKDLFDCIRSMLPKQEKWPMVMKVN